MAEEGSEYEYESLALLPSSQYGGEGGGLSRTKDVPTSMLPSSALYRNFYALSIAFALNHGCVVTCLAYSSTMLGDEMGSVTNGCLYVSYAVVAFVAAKALVATVGPKQSLLLGVMGYCVYVFSFLLAVLLLEEVPALSWALATVGAIAGGAAGGLLWTAQGRYFARNATLYAQQTRQPLEVVNANLSALFATSFLGIETAMKLLATVFFLIFPTSAPAVVFTIYFLVASASVVVVSYLEDLDETGTGAWTYRAVSEDAGKVSRLVYFDRRLTLLLPFQIAFGFASSFVPYYVFGTIIADSSELGSTWVGLLSAVVVLMATLMALPSAWAANKFGKPAVMTVGSLCLAASGLALFFFSDAQLGTWRGVLPYLAVYGVGRGVWETINKAVIADFFASSADACTTAFAATTFFNGYASAMGYFTFASLTREAMASVVGFSALLALVAYQLAFRAERQRRDALADAERVGAFSPSFASSFSFSPSSSFYLSLFLFLTLSSSPCSLPSSVS